VARRVLDEPSEDVVASAKRERAERRRNPFARIALFLRQVVTELKKVVTPTRRELFSFTGVVLVFVVVMMVLVGLLDLAFGTAVSYVFGNGPS
jgi:preprotein translocase subunit SecE